MKILIIAPSWIGDALLSHSVYQLLTQRYHKVKIDVITHEWCHELFYHMPEINKLIKIPFNHGVLALKERYKLGKKIKQTCSYQQALILPNSFKSALIPFFANIPLRTGWRGEMRYGLINDIRKLNQSSFPMIIQRYAALAFDNRLIHTASDLPTKLPWPKIIIKNTIINKTLDFFLLNYNRPLIGLCPGAEFGPAKCWPYYYYANLAKMLIQNGYYIVILGSINDNWIGTCISQQLGIFFQKYYKNLIGKTTITQAMSIMNACKAIISNDSGLMHVASALNRPLIALYGPTSPEFAPPLSYQVKVVRLINGYFKIRADNNKFGYHHSLIAIKPMQVLYALESLLNSL